MYMVDSASSARAGVVSTDGNILIQDAQLETGDIATDYIPTTTTAVSVGPVSNLPRLNYPINADGSVGCPSLLLEPQTTALNLNSEVLSNWTQVRATISSNAITSPDGYQNADGIVASAANDDHFITQNIAVTASAYTFSAFVKKGSKNWVRLWETATDVYVDFNLETGATGTTVGGVTSKGTQDYGNGWLRCYITYTATAGTNPFRVYAMEANNDKTFVGDGSTVDIYVWGINLTQSAYATSYIPTLAASVTRVADACSKTGISSLIGQTEGAVFFEIDQLADVSKLEGILYLSDGTSTTDYMNFYFAFSNILHCDVAVGGVTQASFNLGTITTLTKIALAYKANDFAVYKNGVQIGTDNSGNVPTTSKLTLGATQVGSAVMKGVFAQALLFKTRLTNQQLQELTSL
jgi:hypothetical protein